MGWDCPRECGREIVAHKGGESREKGPKSYKRKMTLVSMVAPAGAPTAATKYAPTRLLTR